MTRYAGLLLFVSFIPGAFAQSQTPASAAAAIEAAKDIKPGDYAGSVNEQGGERSAKVKMTIRDVTDDGRVTATVQSSHARKACAKTLPMNGLVLPEGKMRLTVEDGAPRGCARIYHLTVAEGGTLAGTYVNGNVDGKKPATRKQ